MIKVIKILLHDSKEDKQDMCNYVHYGRLVFKICSLDILLHLHINIMQYFYFP